MSARKGQVMTTKISGRGHFARPVLIDEQDLHLFTEHNWTDNGAGYLVSAERGTGKRLYLHRLIAQPTTGQIVDHINRDTYDMRRKNMKLTDKSGNALNSRKRAAAWDAIRGGVQ